MKFTSENMLASRGEELLAAKRSIEEAIDSKAESGEEKSDSEAFFEYAVDHLMATNAILAPSNEEAGEYVRAHHYEAELRRNSLLRVDGSALIRSDANEYQVHFFIVDYDPSDEVSVITEKEVKVIAKRLRRFHDELFEGRLLNQLNRMHPIYQTAMHLLRMRDRIAGSRLWLLTNRLYDGNTGGYFKDSLFRETTFTIASLKDLASGFESRTGISQNFESIGGLPCLEIPSVPNQDYRCYLTSLQGTTLEQLYRMHGTRLVQANVRAHLGDNVVNKGIKETVENEPQRFLAYNNGIVMSANEVEAVDGRILKITDLQIINGGQTTATLYSYLRGARTHEERDRRNQKLANLRVPVTIIVANAGATEDAVDELRNAITKAANSQTKVKVSDLSANTPFQRRFAEIANNMPLPDGQYLYYERALNQFKAEAASKETPAQVRAFKKKFTDPETNKPRIIQKPDLAMALMVWDGEVKTVAMGRERAYATFVARIEEQKPEVDRRFVQDSLSKLIILSSLEKKAKTELEIRNPRVPVIYTLAFFAQYYGDRIRLDRVWTRQGISYDLERALLDMTREVYRIMKKNMGDTMIAMWGRRAECLASLQREFDIHKFPVENAYELA